MSAVVAKHSSHRVRKLRCDTFFQDFINDDSLTQLRREVEQFLNSTIPELLEDVFDQHDRNGWVYTLDTLSIHIPLSFSGDIDALKTSLIEQCQAQLLTVLGGRATPKTKNQQPRDTGVSLSTPTSPYAKPFDEAEKEAVLFYLQHGFLTWKHQPYKMHLAKTLSQTVRDRQLLDEIKRLMRNDRNVLPRLMGLLPNQLDRLIFSWASGDQGLELFTFWQTIGQSLSHDIQSCEQLAPNPPDPKLANLFAAVTPDADIAGVMRQVLFSALFTIDHKRLSSSQLLGRLMKMLADSLEVDQPLLWHWMDCRFVAQGTITRAQPLNRTTQGDVTLRQKSEAEQTGMHHMNPPTPRLSLQGIKPTPPIPKPSGSMGNAINPRTHAIPLKTIQLIRYKLASIAPAAGVRSGRARPDGPNTSNTFNTSNTSNTPSTVGTSTPLDAVVQFVDEIEYWISQPAVVAREHLISLLHNRAAIVQFSQRISAYQFTQLLAQLRQHDYERLLGAGAVAVDLYCESRPPLQAHASHRSTPHTLLALLDDQSSSYAARLPLLHYLITVFWVLPDQPFEYPQSLFSASQCLASELAHPLITSGGAMLESNQQARITPHTKPADDRQPSRSLREGLALNPVDDNREDPNRDVSGDKSLNRNTYVVNSSAADATRGDAAVTEKSLISSAEPGATAAGSPSNAQDKHTQLAESFAAYQRSTDAQKSLWQQRLLAKLPGWFGELSSNTTTTFGLARPPDNAAARLGESKSDSTSSVKNQRRLLPVYCANERSVLQSIKQALLTPIKAAQRLTVPDFCLSMESLGGPAAACSSSANEAINQPIVVPNAGLILLSVYFERLFQGLGWWEEGRFIDTVCAHRAIRLCGYLSTGQRSTRDIDLALCKVMCGVSLDTCILPAPPLEQSVYDTADSLLTAVINHWTALGNTTNEGLQTSFLTRNGWLVKEPDHWTLNVEGKAFDMLLDQLPWAYSLIKHPWMSQAIVTHWRE